MPSRKSLQHFQRWYARLLRLYPRSYRERFGEGMQQTFNDLCREHAAAGKNLLALALWVYFETARGILKQNLTSRLMKRTFLRAALGTGAILLIPFFGNIFVEGWNWGFFDFLFIGAVIFSVGLVYQLLARLGTIWYRAAVALALLTAFLVVFVNAAVGIIGDHNNANVMFLAVPIIGIAGALVTRFRPQGMSRALLAMAAAQFLIPVIALVIWSPQVISWSPGVLPVFALNAFFVLLLASSALLFRRASAAQSGVNP